MEELKFKGSPGPWKVFARGTLRDVVNDANGVWAALAHAQTHEEAEANARLIAVAPEMLEVLQMFVAMVDFDYPTDSAEMGAERVKAIAGHARKILKKALEE